MRGLVYGAGDHAWRLDEAMKSARASKSGAYIEIIGGKMDMPPALAYAHGRLKEMYGDTP